MKKADTFTQIPWNSWFAVYSLLIRRLLPNKNCRNREIFTGAKLYIDLNEKTLNNMGRA
jgi:hypothetical protein